MATPPRGPRGSTPVTTMLTGGLAPAQLAKLTPEERAQLLKRMKGAMPANGSAPATAPGAGGGATTIFS